MFCYVGIRGPKDYNGDTITNTSDNCNGSSHLKEVEERTLYISTVSGVVRNFRYLLQASLHPINHTVARQHL